MPLTDTTIRNARAVNRPFKLFDGGGLHLLVNPTGSKLWRLKYRVDGREKLLSLGAYPAVDLKAARQARDRAKELLAGGCDPSDVKKAAKRGAEISAASTFRQVAAELTTKMRTEQRAAVTIAKADWLIGMANASLGDRPISEIKAREVLAVVKVPESDGKYETAKRLRAIISRVSRLAVATDRAETDPTFALRGALAAVPATPHAAITDVARIRDLFHAVDAYGGSPATKAALKLLALLVPRPGELRRASWTEFDLTKGVWIVPQERMKMRRPHRVPLPGLAVETLEGLKSVTGWAELVFPSVRSPKTPMSENTLNGALRRMGYSKHEMTSHGFRAAFSTIANESGLWNPDAIERALAHVDTNTVRRAYARGEHWEERIRLADWWARQLDDCS